MKFSIITPTIERPSLDRCRESVRTQTYTEWEHIVMVDLPRTNNYGNSPRHNGWKRASGDYCIYLDDDNYFADANALQRVADALVSRPDWAIFPIMRHGLWFFNDPPGNCRTDTANMVIGRDISQWPDGPEYTMDGLFCDQLKAKYPYAAFPKVAPIIVMETSGRGQ